MAAAFQDNDELWRQCAVWLTKLEILRPDHRANWQEAGIVDLANTLRDGVLLCKLLNKIDPISIDMKDVNLKPIKAQFLCLRNIDLFLKACVGYFGLKESDLFEPLMLFDLTNFHKVLCTLSKLSLTEKAQQTGIVGFTSHRVKTKEEEVIYQRLKSLAPIYTRELVDPVCDETSEEIYQDLCVHQTSVELQPTFEKRDFVIRELLDTEKNYVDVLNKLRRNFMKPLMNIMRPCDHETIFYKIHELYEIHNCFYNELIRIRFDSTIKLGSIFIKWREKFLIYGGYCANLSKATNLLQDLCDTDEIFNQSIIKYEKEDNNGRFKLRDVLSVPMQRILKYHLLLEKLKENTDPNHEEYNDLQRSREAMLDVAGYINEAARDSEHLAVISNLQDNIVEWLHTNDCNLSDYGRLIRDGELKIKAHDDQKTKNRYVFIFDKCILLCKQLKGQQFAFRSIINISDYYIDENPNRTVMNKDTRWSYHFHLVKNDNVMVYTLFLRSIELKEQMIKAINEALDNIHPQSMKRTNHTFELQTFDKPIQCFHCSKYLKGLIYQGYKCAICNIGVHKICIAYSGRCGVLYHPPSSTPSSSSSLTSITIQQSLQNNCLLLNGDDENQLLLDKLWFVGEMDRTKAQNILEKRENGTFLVRIRPHSDERDKYALSLKTNNTVKHMKICNTLDNGEDKKYYLSLSKFFSNIDELILNYQMYSLKENFERLEENTKLLWPYRQLYATVLKNFDPSDGNQLSLKEGSQIIIIGKEGYREGWWKGRSELNEVGYFPSNYVKIDGEVKFHY